MITIDLVLGIHRVLIKRYGGSEGILDREGLESAIGRPYQTFDGKELYPTSVEKAAAILESIVKNHPFLDGNKRTAYALMRIVLLNDSKDINATEDDKYNFIIKIAAGQSNFEQILDWVKSKVEDSSFYSDR